MGQHPCGGNLQLDVEDPPNQSPWGFQENKKEAARAGASLQTHLVGAGVGAGGGGRGEGRSRSLMILPVILSSSL